MDGFEKELDCDALIALFLEPREENAQLRKRIAELEQQPPRRQPDQTYSVEAEEKRQQEKSGRKHRQQSPRRGRKPTLDKLDRAERAEIVLPDGCTIGQCTWLRERPVWRIEQGRAVLIAYDIYRGPGGELPAINGVLPRSEYGLEIHVSVAFLTLVIVLSMDKVCSLLKFFWNLDLPKSQADALLNRLAREWESEFGRLCRLVADSAVVHADETGWSINSVWALLSERARLLIFGVHKDAATLDIVLPKATFEGILVSDDAAVYRGFSTSQKCWAHLLRKAIRLTLQEPDNRQYRLFLDEMLDVYRTACRFSQDGRLGESGRRWKVDQLNHRMYDLLGERYDDPSEPADDIERDFVNLVHELVRLLGNEELFTFVLHPEAGGTNNEAERSLRGAALDRKTGRTSKTPRGARRLTVLVSVFESLRLHLPEFTLASVLAETGEWFRPGRSLFDRLISSSGLAPPDEFCLARLLPAPAE